MAATLLQIHVLKKRASERRTEWFRHANLELADIRERDCVLRAPAGWVVRIARDSLAQVPHTGAVDDALADGILALLLLARRP